VYECVGAGKDLCDVGGSAAVDNTGDALVRTTTGTVVLLVLLVLFVLLVLLRSLFVLTF
jgi:hypothetical protein